MRRMNPRFALLCPVLLAAACDQPIMDPAEPQVADLEQSMARRLPPDVAQFNPQPEPPADRLAVTLFGQLDGALRGSYRAGAVNDAVMVETLASIRRGNSLYLTQRWMIYPPTPIHPPDPVQPLVLELRGVVDLATGLMTMQGATAGGRAAYVRAQATFGKGGVSVGGDVMFNPQPEPPEPTIG